MDQLDYVAKLYIKGMWYLRKLASSCEQFKPVSTNLCPEYNFFPKILFFNFGTKSHLPTSDFIFSTISRILKSEFYVFFYFY